jgi:hypothetical protein
MTNFDRIIRARTHKAYDIRRAYNGIMFKISYSRTLHPYAPSAAEAALHILRKDVHDDIDRLILYGYEDFYSAAATSIFHDTAAKNPLCKASYAVSIYDIMKDYSDADLIGMYESQLHWVHVATNTQMCA